VTTFGAVGYCFGARYAVDLALENTTKAIAMAHPSLLQVPADFEALMEKSSNPILINSCEFDDQFPPEKQKITDELMGGGKYKPGYEQVYFPGCSHGFAVRGDLVSCSLTILDAS
jgi:dienelactone hydrolase